MPGLLNGAGGAVQDPILGAIPTEYIVVPNSMDITTVVGIWFDATATVPGTNAATVSPTITTILMGTAGSVDTTGLFTIASTTGLAVGDYIYLSHPAATAITAGIYKVATIPSGTTFTLTSNPFGGVANTNISYEVAWRWSQFAGTSPSLTGAAATQNWFKSRLQNSIGNNTDTVDTLFIMNAPPLAGTTYISLGGKAADGSQTVNNTSPAFAFLTGGGTAWTNKGGVTYLGLANHSVQAVNNFTFSDSTVTEKTLASVITNGLKMANANAMNYGRLLLKSASGGASLGIDISLAASTSSPVVTTILQGR